MKKRACAAKIRCLFLAGMISFFVVCSALTDAQDNHDSKSKEDSMSLAYQTELSMIPAIDAAVSSNFETASFGLG
jgi:hypothetical protein